MTLQGKDGENGLGLYELALEDGFEGTVEEFLEEMRGPQGPAGTPGTNGIDGKDGLPGINGRDGKDGTDGIDGALDAVNIFDIKNPSMDQLQIRIDGGSGSEPRNWNISSPSHQ